MTNYLNNQPSLDTITCNKQDLINLIQAFILQGADDRDNFGHVFNPEEYEPSIKLQLKQLEINKY
jgi:hypothetical protein